MTSRQLARFLKNEHSQRSWSEISQAHYDGLIPGGTLSRIASSNGDYIPNKWRAWLGLGKPKASGRHHMKRLADMSPAEILRTFRLVEM